MFKLDSLLLSKRDKAPDGPNRGLYCPPTSTRSDTTFSSAVGTKDKPVRRCSSTMDIKQKHAKVSKSTRAALKRKKGEKLARLKASSNQSERKKIRLRRNRFKSDVNNSKPHKKRASINVNTSIFSDELSIMPKAHPESYPKYSFLVPQYESVVPNVSPIPKMTGVHGLSPVHVMPTMPMMPTMRMGPARPQIHPVPGAFGMPADMQLGNPSLMQTMSMMYGNPQTHFIYPQPGPCIPSERCPNYHAQGRGGHAGLVFKLTDPNQCELKHICQENPQVFGCGRWYRLQRQQEAKSEGFLPLLMVMFCCCCNDTSVFEF
ncbi:hypothetical protein EGW08_015003 [Elysia chlorotica]|uniref:Uncharacterized protein n=1 Tax=Elysia chlorotica TaxID=188477 RepID=A0A433T6S4_ELYCH|nr:hypothetical protein EGW08_015003 [Elysia chlorotica]